MKTKKSFKLFFAGYTYPETQSWYSISAQTIGTTYNYPIYACRYKGLPAIRIGEYTQIWRYPKVWINKINFGYNISPRLLEDLRAKMQIDIHLIQNGVDIDYSEQVI